MEDSAWHLILIASGGLVVLLCARLSRKRWIKEYGDTSNQDKLRFGICLVVNFGLLTAIAHYDFLVFVVVVSFFAVIAQFGVGWLSLLDEYPGLRKDLVYSGIIGALLAAFTGLLTRAP